MANQSSKKNSKPAWQARRPMGSLPGIIALIGVAALLVTWLVQNSALGQNPARASGAESGLRISEIMASNASTLVGDDMGIVDWIELENTGDAPIELTGFSLMRETKPAQAFAFPGGTLQPGEFVLVYADDSGKALQADGYHAPFRLPASGEDLALIDKAGNGVDLVELPALARDQVYCRDAAGQWAEGPLEISEVMADNATFFPDENGLYHDYVEIHNRSNNPVNLEGWYLSDKSEKLMRWAFPSVTLPAGGYLAVHCSGEERKSDPAHLHASFRLSNKGDNVFLTHPSGVTVSHVKTPVMEADQCYSLLETGWSNQFSPTPNQPNTQAGADVAAAQIEQLNTVGVRITEVLASSSKSDDWIELYNPTAAAVDLSGYGLSDNAGRPRKWQFPSGTVIQPGQYLGVFG